MLLQMVKLLRTYRFGQPLINRGLSEHSRFLEQHQRFHLLFQPILDHLDLRLELLSQLDLYNLNLLAVLVMVCVTLLQPPHILRSFLSMNVRTLQFLRS